MSFEENASTPSVEQGDSTSGLTALQLRLIAKIRADRNTVSERTEAIEQKVEVRSEKSELQEQKQAEVKEAKADEEEAKERRDDYQEDKEFYQSIHGKPLDVAIQAMQNRADELGAKNAEQPTAAERGQVHAHGNLEKPSADPNIASLMLGIADLKKSRAEAREAQMVEIGQRTYKLLKYDFSQASEEAFTKEDSPFRRVIAGMPRIADSTSQELVAQNYQTTDKSFDHMLNNFVVQSLLVAKEHGITPDPTDPLAPITEVGNPFFINLDGTPANPANWRNPLKVAEDISEATDARRAGRNGARNGQRPTGITLFFPFFYLLYVLFVSHCGRRCPRRTPGCPCF